MKDLNDEQLKEIIFAQFEAFAEKTFYELNEAVAKMNNIQPDGKEVDEGFFNGTLPVMCDGYELVVYLEDFLHVMIANCIK